MRVSLSDEAQADADAAVDWYIGEGAYVAADDFADELDRALDLLKRFPELGGAITLELRVSQLPKHSWVKISQIRTLAVERIGARIGRASPVEMSRVVEGLNETIEN